MNDRVERFDITEAPVLRANGKHRAVPLVEGAREVVLSYHPPGLVPGLVVSSLSLLVALAAWVAAPRRRTS